MPFVLSFGQVESVLAALHKIADEKRVTFQTRLKFFQRLGFPEGVNTGKGKAAGYQAHHVLNLALALELLQLGLSGERQI
jgi:hypothetical protein